MLSKTARTLVVAGVVACGAVAPACADILIITVGEKTGEILDTEKIPDGSDKITVEVIMVPGQ